MFIDYVSRKAEMSWTTENERSWRGRRDNLESSFKSLLEQYKQAVSGDPGNVIRHNALAAQMTTTREELSQLGYVLKDSLEDLRTKAGNIEEPARQLEKILERITAEENTLKRKKETREEQVASLESRSLKNAHTIGFLMMRPLTYPLYTAIIAGILWLFAGITIFMYSKQFMNSAGITVPQPSSGQFYTRQNYRSRIG
jgi:hypothetical protein